MSTENADIAKQSISEKYLSKWLDETTIKRGQSIVFAEWRREGGQKDENSQRKQWMARVGSACKI